MGSEAQGDQVLRVIIVPKIDETLARTLDGLTVDGRGSVMVGGIIYNQSEARYAFTGMLSMMVNHEKGYGPAVDSARVGRSVSKKLGDPRFLLWRQRLFAEAAEHSLFEPIPTASKWA